MAGKFSVDPNQLQATAKFLQDASQSYQRIYQTLLNKASSMGAAYDSDDNRAFVSQIQGCAGDLRAMAQRLDDAADILTKQKNNYEQQLEANIAAVRRL